MPYANPVSDENTDCMMRSQTHDSDVAVAGCTTFRILHKQGACNSAQSGSGMAMGVVAGHVFIGTEG
jgi:hypothetical protein